MFNVDYLDFETGLNLAVENDAGLRQDYSALRGLLTDKDKKMLKTGKIFNYGNESVDYSVNVTKDNTCLDFVYCNREGMYYFIRLHTITEDTLAQMIDNKYHGYYTLGKFLVEDKDKYARCYDFYLEVVDGIGYLKIATTTQEERKENSVKLEPGQLINLISDNAGV